MPESHQGNSGVWKSHGRLRLLAYGLRLLIVLSVAGWAGAVSSSGLSPSATKVAGGSRSVRFFARSSPAITTPTVMPTPTARVSLPVGEHIAYLPLAQKQKIILGSLSIEEVYTTDYDGRRQATFRPCQAVVLWIRMRNDAPIPQPATLFWQTQDPEGKPLTNLSAYRRVDVPPGESTWRFRRGWSADLRSGLNGWVGNGWPAA